MTIPEPSVRIRVDVTNPGQFFACCGLLELAGRLTPDAVGWFERGVFCMSASPKLPELLSGITGATVEQVDPDDATASPVQIPLPFGIRLDWWKANERAVWDLKVWGGKMGSFRIARAMQYAMQAPGFASEELLNIGAVAYDPENPNKKVEPFFFDARRGPNAHSRDVGFSPNDLQLKTVASPAAEFLCLVGLQRTRPVPVPGMKQLFDYCAWSRPLPATLTPPAVAGILPDSDMNGYRFEIWYRSSKRVQKAFLSARPIMRSRRP